MTTNCYFALDLASSTGFYFESFEEYEMKMAKADFDEVEIQYIDGDAAKLWDACKISQATIETWFDELEEITEEDRSSLRYLLDTGYDIQEAIEKFDEVQIWRGSAEDYAADLVEQTTDTSSLGWLGNYIDYERIANDMALNSEITEIEHEIWVVNCNEF